MLKQNIKQNKMKNSTNFLDDNCHTTFNKINGEEMINISKESVINAMKEFAKYHVETALKEASSCAQTKNIKYTDDIEVDIHSILNSYDLSKII